MSSTGIYESSCMNGDWTKCKFSGSDCLLLYKISRKCYHFYCELDAFLLGNPPFKLHLQVTDPVQ